MTTRILKTQTTKRPPVISLVCPSCRGIRKARPVGNATVAGIRREVVECQDDTCGLQWIPGRTAIPNAA